MLKLKKKKIIDKKKNLLVLYDQGIQQQYFVSTIQNHCNVAE